MKTGISFLILLGLMLIMRCSEGQKTTQSNESDIQSVFEQYYQQRLVFNPLEATQAGLEGYNDKLPNLFSEEYIEAEIDFLNRTQQELMEFDQEKLTQTQSISLQALQWEIDERLKGLRNEIPLIKSPLFGLPMIKQLPLNQIFSLHLYMGQLGSGGSAQPFNTTMDYHHWLQRMDDFLALLDGTMENMKLGIEQGVVHPKVITEKMINQLDPFIAAPTTEHIFYGPIRQIPEEFSEAETEELTSLYREMIETKLVPKYKQLQEFLSVVYLPACRETSGIGQLPGGLETYNLLISWHTSTTMTAEQIHQLGLNEVTRIEKEMEQVKQQVGFEGNLKEFFNHVRTSKDQMPFTEPGQVMENFEKIHSRMEPYLDELFDLRPKANFEIRRTESYREASASAEYSTGAVDGSRPGIFYVPIPDVKKYNKYADESLFLHEAIPGHHYQLSLQQENREIPSFMHSEALGVFVEGWALYSESLGSELGLYKDPYQYFGMLSAEMHRAIRLVVDTGIHAKEWTREQAIAYSLDHEAESEASIIAEIERYMVAPGQALSYKIGQLKIIELRTHAEQTLGDRFDIKEFHNQVLGSGSLPLEVLEQKINSWIESYGESS